MTVKLLKFPEEFIVELVRDDEEGFGVTLDQLGRIESVTLHSVVDKFNEDAREQGQYGLAINPGMRLLSVNGQERSMVEPLSLSPKISKN